MQVFYNVNHSNFNKFVSSSFHEPDNVIQQKKSTLYIFKIYTFPTWITKRKQGSVYIYNLYSLFAMREKVRVALVFACLCGGQVDIGLWG